MKPWVHAVGYQVTWFVTVLSGNLVSLLWLLPMGFLVLYRASHRALIYIGVVALLGYSIDLALQATGFIQFNHNTVLGPLWLLVLWVGFADVIWHLLYRIPKWWFQAVLGAISGPLSYVTGAALGAAEPMTTGGIIAFAIWWAIGFPAFVAGRHWFARRGAAAEDPPLSTPG